MREKLRRKGREGVRLGVHNQHLDLGQDDLLQRVPPVAVDAEFDGDVVETGPVDQLGVPAIRRRRIREGWINGRKPSTGNTKVRIFSSECRRAAV